jgi:hypothetical protein
MNHLIYVYVLSHHPPHIYVSKWGGGWFEVYSTWLIHYNRNRNRNKFINQIRAPGGHIQITIMIDTQQQYIKLNIRGEISIIVVQAHSGDLNHISHLLHFTDTSPLIILQIGDETPDICICSLSSPTPPHIYVSKCMYVYVHISLFLPECACTTIIDISPRIFSLMYCCVGWERTYTYIRWFITNLQETPWVDAKRNKVLLVSSADRPCWYRRISMWKERGETHKHAILFGT